MNRGPGTLRTVMIVLGSSWFGFVLNILRVLVLPAKLGDLGLGDVTTAVSFTTFFGIFISLGTSIYLVRAVAQDQSLASRYLSNALLLRVVMGAGVLACGRDSLITVLLCWVSWLGVAHSDWKPFAHRGWRRQWPGRSRPA